MDVWCDARFHQTIMSSPDGRMSTPANEEDWQSRYEAKEEQYQVLKREFQEYQESSQQIEVSLCWRVSAMNGVCVCVCVGGLRCGPLGRARARACPFSTVIKGLSAFARALFHCV